MSPTDPQGTRPSLRQRFPALARLTLQRRRRKIPFVQQTAVTDCGAACLTMVLAYHGKELKLEVVRQSMGLSRDGIDALTLLQAGRHYGLRGRGIKVQNLDDLRFVEPGAILHWRFNHFVVFQRMERRGAWVVDPGLGRRFVHLKELSRSFTGVALSFEPGEDFEPQGGGSTGIGRYLAKVLSQSGLLSRILVTSLLIQVFALAVPVITRLVVDRVVPRQDSKLLLILSLGLAGLVLFKLLASLIRSFLFLHLRTRLDAQMTLEFLEHLVALPFLFFQQRSHGDLMMRLNSNATIREILTSSAVSGVLDGSMVSFYLILLLVTNAKMGLLVLGLGVFQMGVFLVTRRRQRELMSELLQAQADSRGYQVQLLAGIESLKASGAEQRAVDHWSNLFVNELNVSLARGRLDAIVNSLLEAMATAAPLAILLYGTRLVIGGELTLGTMLGLNALAMGFLTPLSTLVSTATQLQLLGSYLDRINDVLETPREQEEEARQRPMALRGRITLQNVTFRYNAQAPPAVRDVSVEIRPGQLVAIVGASGSGKSTLAGLLAGLYRPERGRILYDDHDLAELDLRWLRSQLGFVAQMPYLFALSVRNNIGLNHPDLPFSRILEAARLAAIDEEVRAMPMGYETLLAAGGASISGGQRQRIALARALLHRPKILILDEATSALDALTERAIQENLARLRSTRVVIAHRLSTVRKADLILVMDHSALVEQGCHEELLAKSGIYQQLVAAQLERDDEESLAS